MKRFKNVYYNDENYIIRCFFNGPRGVSIFVMVLSGKENSFVLTCLPERGMVEIRDKGFLVSLEKQKLFIRSCPMNNF